MHLQIPYHPCRVVMETPARHLLLGMGRKELSRHWPSANMKPGSKEDHIT